MRCGQVQLLIQQNTAEMLGVKKESLAEIEIMKSKTLTQRAATIPDSSNRLPGNI